MGFDLKEGIEEGGGRVWMRAPTMSWMGRRMKRVRPRRRWGEEKCREEEDVWVA
jgi:hypothetical protein